MTNRIKELEMPEFILSSNPMQEYDGLDWIYCPKYLSLVLVIYPDDVNVFLDEENRNQPHKTYFHEDEEFELVIIQNNVLITGGQLAPEITEFEFLDSVWKWYEEYLYWEDNNLDEEEQTWKN